MDVDRVLVVTLGGCKGRRKFHDQKKVTRGRSLDLATPAARSPPNDPELGHARMAETHKWAATREEGLARLADFAPLAGADYAKRRNFDLGPGQHKNVSQLSPYIRHRLIREDEVLLETLKHHSPASAEKFIQEVYWRTYWKGWLEMRPAVWGAYWSELALAWDQVQTQSGLRQEWEAACNGETGIDCFDAWAKELVETGYLHNHSRMWFASIWIFTLRLPWALGADFFMRHLLDGDPASNTLSWRWVGGLQTVGKTYLARTSNISKFTEGRFHPQYQLASHADPLQGAPHPPRMDAPEGDRFDPEKRTAFLLHEDDLTPDWLFEQGLKPVATATISTAKRLSILQPAPHVLSFKSAAIDDCLSRLADKTGPVTKGLESADQIAHWAASVGAEQIVTSYPPVGPVADILRGKWDIPMARVLHDFDRDAWPHAKAGFFKFKEKIPHLLGNIRNLRLI